MAREVNWNKHVYDRFCELAMLSDFEKQVLETRIKGYSIIQQSMMLGCSESTINKTIKVLKKKYDDVQTLQDSGLKPRRTSKEEEWMDSH